jgi:hypothetical protein
LIAVTPVNARYDGPQNDREWPFVRSPLVIDD